MLRNHRPHFRKRETLTCPPLLDAPLLPVKSGTLMHKDGSNLAATKIMPRGNKSFPHISISSRATVGFFLFKKFKNLTRVT